MGRYKKVYKKFLICFLSFFLLLTPIAYISATVSVNNAYADEVNPGNDNREGTDDNEGTDDSGDATSCKDADLRGANWIACGMMENANEATGGLFEMVEGMLDVDTDWYSIDGGGGQVVYKVWGFCRDTANVLMAIFLLAVIFSQLTGYGIDNYGIKKTLPKLIVMAILVNVSFYICQIAVDLSNIIGSGLDDWLTGIAGGEGTAITTALSALVAGGSLAGAAAGTVGSVATFAVGIGAGGWVLVVIVALVLLVVVIIGLLIVLIMMGIRLMIIAVFIGISPIAFACYILPNTKSLFKKWTDIFKGALLVYPIVGALHGFSAIIRNIIWASNEVDLVMVIVGCVAAILPYYIIPSLLKKVINATGMIGSAINGLGQSIKHGYQQGMGAVKNSEAFKRTMDNGRNEIANRSAARTLNRADTELAKGKNLTESERSERTQLADRVRGGTATEDEKKRLAALDKKNLEGYRSNYVSKVANARKTQEDYDAKKGAQISGASAILSSGRIEEARTKQQLSDQGALNSTRGYYQDAEGNVYTKLSSDYTDEKGKTWKAGSYIRSDSENGTQGLTASDVDAKVRPADDDDAGVRANSGRMVSQREAMLNQDQINRDKQYGALGAYATNTATINIGSAANAANLSSLGSGVDSLASSIQAGEGKVLQVQHVKADNKQIIENAGNKAFFENIDDLRLDKDAAKQNIENIALKKVYEEAADNSISIPKPDLEVIKAGAAQKQQQKVISDITSALGTSNGYDWKGTKYYSNSKDSLAKMLEAIGKTGTVDDDTSAMLAVVEQLKAKGGDGLDVISKAINSGVFAGNPDLGKRLVDSIVSDGKIKSQDTVFFKKMLDIQSKINAPTATSTTVGAELAAGAISNARIDASYAGSLKADYVGSMTDEAFDNIFGNGTNLGLSTDPTVKSLAYQALNNPDTIRSLKQKQIDQLKSITQNYVPPLNAQERAAQERAEVERMAERRGKGTDEITDITTAEKFKVYAYPKGTNGFDGSGRWEKDTATGDWIYTDSTGKKWNGSTGTYV